MNKKQKRQRAIAVGLSLIMVASTILGMIAPVFLY